MAQSLIITHQRNFPDKFCVLSYGITMIPCTTGTPGFDKISAAVKAALQWGSRFSLDEYCNSDREPEFFFANLPDRNTKCHMNCGNSAIVLVSDDGFDSFATCASCLDAAVEVGEEDSAL